MPALPIVIIGNGPVGMHAARLLLEHDTTTQVILYGAEQHQPYNRVKLSSVLAGIDDWDTLQSDLRDLDDSRFIKRFGCAITEFDPINKTVTDEFGCVQPYARLILATGSQPHIPQIPGMPLKGRYTLRSLDDVSKLIARQVSSRHTVILGGGLLGLEAARAMQRWHTEVTVIEHASHLLSRQLDEEAGALLAEQIQASGIQLIVNDGVRSIDGKDKVRGLTLYSGKQIACDTVIIATGIVPNKALAMLAGLHIGRGIKVNDQMQTSDPDIYAIGECAEHRERVYGLVAPGLEQAGVAVHNILGGSAAYHGAIAASRLKVLNHAVLSIGPVGEDARIGYGRSYVYRDAENGVYRKLLVHRNRLVGALSVNDWDEAARIQTHASQQKLVYPWQLLRFRLTGYLWPQQDMPGVCEWPAGATICQCTGVTRGAIGSAIEAGASSCEQITQKTGAASVCGSCRPLISELLGSTAKPEPHHQAGALLVSAIAGLLLAVLFLLPWQIPYAETATSKLSWDWLWRNSLAKQVSGFTVLGLFGIGLLVSLRKRWSAMANTGSFDVWRMAHIVLGILALLTLLAHTGLRSGHGLNLWLMLSFTGLILLGSVYSATLGLQHRLSTTTSTRLRKKSLNWHIYLFWPVPVLLGFHILKSYWF